MSLRPIYWCVSDFYVHNLTDCLYQSKIIFEIFFAYIQPFKNNKPWKRTQFSSQIMCDRRLCVPASGVSIQKPSLRFNCLSCHIAHFYISHMIAWKFKLSSFKKCRKKKVFTNEINLFIFSTHPPFFLTELITMHSGISFSTEDTSDAAKTGYFGREH